MADMFRPLPLFIGFRYTRAKRRSHFVSFVSLASMLGIALGVAVLITVLSVMNGFDHEIHNRIFSLARQVTITGEAGAVNNWSALEKVVLRTDHVLAAAPYVSSQGMLSRQGMVNGVMVNGILPEQEAQISSIQKMMSAGSMSALTPGKFGIVIGQQIATNLSAEVGDKITLVIPQASVTPVGVIPRFKPFTVVGIFHVGEGFGYDSSAAFINLNDAQKLFQMGNSVTGLNLKISDLYVAPLVSHSLRLTLPEEYAVSDWTNIYGTYFKAIQMEKTTMFVVLLFIIAVAAFNLVSSLVMTVNDKQADIAILRTLGASPRAIMMIFMVQGGIIGAFGTLLGVVGGIVLALNAPELVKILEQIFNTHFISASIYFINYLPSKLEWLDVVRIGVTALILSLLATLYPAWRAAKTQPAEALRYE